MCAMATIRSWSCQKKGGGGEVNASEIIKAWTGQDKISLDTTIVRTESLEGGLLERIFQGHPPTLSSEV